MKNRKAPGAPHQVPLMNDRIISSMVQLVDPTWGPRLLSRDEALEKARREGLDLVVVDGRQPEPVCRLLDWNKEAYKRQKHERKQRTTTRQQQAKEIRLRMGTGEADLETKARQAQRFLEKGHRLKVSLRMKGRENAYPDKAREHLHHFAQRLQKKGKTQGSPKPEGRQISCWIDPAP